MCASLTALVILLRLPTFVTRLFDPDEAAIAVQAMVVRAGGTLYRDIYDRKPPLPPLAYALSFSITDSNDVRPLRVLVTLCLAGAGIVVALDAHRRHGRAAAWWAGVLVIAGAMALWPAAAGAALGLAILSRQSWLLGAAPALYAAFRVGRWRQALVLAGAAALVVASTGLYAPLGQFWEWNVANSPGFVFAPAGFGASAGRGLAAVGAFIGFHVTLVACLVVAWRRRPPYRS